MASNTLTGDARTIADRPEPARRQKRSPLLRVLDALASLRLTVVLFALAIMLIFAGTLAQVNKDIWEVMGLYFRAWVAWIPLQVFFPASFFPSKAMQAVPGGFYFPGGFLIGSAMAINLLAAHGVRFTVQARGARLAAGLATVALGVLGHLGGRAGRIGQGDCRRVRRDLTHRWLWGGVEAALGMLWLSIAVRHLGAAAERVWERRLLIAAGAILGVVLGVLLYEGPAIMPDPSAMRILWQLVKATSAALVLLAGCILIFRKRAGIVLLHAGVGLMMANELVVYSLHAEGDDVAGRRASEPTMPQDVRSVELADHQPGRTARRPGDGREADAEGTLEDVTVVPGQALEKRRRDPQPAVAVRRRAGQILRQFQAPQSRAGR